MVGGLNRCVAHLAHVFRQSDTDRAVAAQSANDFDHLHQWHRIEEMQTGETSWLPEFRGNRGD